MLLYLNVLPFHSIDDHAEKRTKGSDINDVVVDLYNHGKTERVPKSIPLIATNYKLQRYLYTMTSIYIDLFDELEVN